MATITQSNSDNFLTWQKVNGTLTLANLQANGIISGIASASMDAEVEWTKGANSTQTKTLTITNTGTIPLTLTAAFSGNDTTYFNFDNGASFNIAVGASHNLIMSVDLASSGIYITTLNIIDIRASIGAIGLTARLAHISIDDVVTFRKTIPTDATVLAVTGSGNIGINTINAVAIPTSDVNITSVFSPTVQTWLLAVDSISPSFTGAMNFRESSTVYNTRALISVSEITAAAFVGYVGVADYFGIAALGWDGAELYFEIV